MGRKKKVRRGRQSGAPQQSWLSMSDERRRTLVRAASKTLLLLVFLTTAVVTTVELQARVRNDLVNDSAPSVVFVDLPESLGPLAHSDLQSAVVDLVARDWLDDGLCHDMALRLGTSGWLSRVNYVRRSGDARFEISGQYRFPLAMVQQGNDFLLTDAEGVRLPGVYLFDPRWKVIQGVRGRVPKPGSRWEDPGLVAGLVLVEMLAVEPFDNQITGVLVDNVGGRLDRSRSHIELATDRAGGRIHWGSAPGEELAENFANQKLTILRENYRRTGRADAHHPVIDVSTFPDRYVIPG